MPTRTESIWNATHQLRRFAPLTRGGNADVAIVGGGISGLTAAVVLARAGRSVVVLEKDTIGGGETGHTTSHLTEAVDGRYRELARTFGDEAAMLVARSSREAIDWIEALGKQTGVDTGFSRVPGILYTENREDIDQLADELNAAGRAGCAVTWVDSVPVPFSTHGGVRWEAQAQVHATAYLEALLHEAQSHGVRFHDRTRVTGIHDGEPCRIETEHGEVEARHVFVAANVPINNRVFLHTKIAAYRSYAIAAEAPPGLQGALLWDTASPYHYTRTQTIGGTSYVIIGGEDHRTGADDETERRYQAIGDYARDRFGVTAVKFRWSGQIIEPVDGLPYIGLNTGAAHVFVATGYSGNGMTFGTLAGLIVGDLIVGRPNPYADLYAATRVTVGAAADYVQENAPFPAHLLADRLTSHDVDERPVGSLKNGEGAVFAGKGGKVAVCRDRQGSLHAVSAVCTHLACDVAWNGAEQTWDCPCHGSRFSPEGKVINGPAVTDLAAKPIPELAGSQRRD
jgi:glycine/D-amino acid oxidase-like deaminating enzyme/nitrite reductase/ring-hydroxylating ferredoxin subunit